MRTVGLAHRYSETPSPQEAWRRGAALDCALKRTMAPPESEPCQPRVQRLSHTEMNAQDDARMVERAKLLNTVVAGHV